MTDPVVEHLRRSALSFIGTVQRLGSATVADIPVDDHTAVVQVDQLLHAPESLKQLAGMPVTVQLDPAADLPAPGDRAAFFVNPSVLGTGLAADEVARLPVSAVQALVATAAPGESPLASVQQTVAGERLRQHADQADAVVVGKVTRLENAGHETFGEHDPDWWRATLDVVHVERGTGVTGPQVDVLYANSLDVFWRSSPKPRAGQEGLWLLHGTPPELRDAAPFQIPHPEDYQPVTSLDQLRGGR